MKPWKEQIKSPKFWVRNLLTLLFVAFLVVEVPLIINRCYLPNKGYLTVWGGSEVLSYYGTLLGAVATIVALFSTIQFTKRQIASERHIRYKQSKWNRIEDLFVSAISLVQPLTLFKIFMSGIKSPVEGCAELKKHMFEVWGIIDILSSEIASEDELKVSELLTVLKKIATKKEALATKYFDLLIAYHAVQESSNDENAAAKTLLLLNQKKSISDEVDELHKNEYQHLLKLKKSCFEHIYSSIEESAEDILHGAK